MTPRLLRRLLIVAAAFLLGPAASAHALLPGQVFGMGDQRSVEMFDDPRFDALGIGATRIIVPWDVALSNTPRFRQADAMIQGATRKGIPVLIAFDGLYRKVAPSPARYYVAVEQAMKRWRTAEYAAWNEANHSTQPTFRRPDLAARYALAVDRLCNKHRCRGTVPVTMVLLHEHLRDARWLARFESVYKKPVKRWGLHTYGDANRRDHTRLARFLLQHPKGQVWLTETAAWEHFSTAWPSDLARQASRTRQVFAPALMFPSRIKRVYWYQWRGTEDPLSRWDSGLLAPDGTSRPAYHVALRERYRTRRAVDMKVPKVKLPRVKPAERQVKRTGASRSSARR